MAVKSNSGGDTLRFERFDIDTARRQLRVNGTPLMPGARAFDLLAALIEHRNRVGCSCGLGYSRVVQQVPIVRSNGGLNGKPVRVSLVRFSPCRHCPRNGRRRASGNSSHWA